MSALTDQWLIVHAASVACQNTATDIVSASLDGSAQMPSRVAAFQAVQNVQIANLDTQIQALQALLLLVAP